MIAVLIPITCRQGHQRSTRIPGLIAAIGLQKSLELMPIPAADL